MFDFDQPPIKASIATATSQHTAYNHSDAILVIAAAPINERRIVALWTELECFVVGSTNHVVLSTPHWARPIMHRLLQEVRRSIPHFASGDVQIEARFFENQRYDAGLWCDGLQGLDSKYKHFLLLNDSIFALRRFTGILDTLRSTNHDVVSLIYNKFREEEKIWIESVFRGFNAHGLSVFMNHSCVPASDPSYSDCLSIMGYKGQKRCIVENHEIGLAWRFPPIILNRTDNKISGLYDGMVPQRMYSRKSFTPPTWTKHRDYWKFLVKEKEFPAAKSYYFKPQILQNCTEYLNRTYLKEINYDLAKQMINDTTGDTRHVFETPISKVVFGSALGCKKSQIAIWDRACNKSLK